MINRKLVRPKLADIKGKTATQSTGPEPQRQAVPGGRRRIAPSEQTNAEAFYYLKQMNTQTPMVIILEDGEELRGTIEWYDRGCIKVHRDKGPNLMVFKHSIRYLYKQEDE